MSCTNRFAAAAALVGLLGMSSLTVPAAAQGPAPATASIAALAYVEGIAPLTASGVNDLNFGTVLPGTPKTPAAATDFGRFSISGEPNTPVTVSFTTLPTVLTGAGSATIGITFGTTDGLVWAPYPTTSTTFNPNAPHLTSMDATGSLIIGISGTVSAPVPSTTGNYSGTIVLTVAY